MRVQPRHGPGWMLWECKGHLVNEYEGLAYYNFVNDKLLVYGMLRCIILWRTRDILSLAACTLAFELALEKLFV